jgi:hypothetical protein
MMDKTCNCGNGGHGMMMLECCQEHKMSKEHLKLKKEMLEEKLKWINEKLEEK